MFPAKSQVAQTISKTPCQEVVLVIQIWPKFDKSQLQYSINSAWHSQAIQTNSQTIGGIPNMKEQLMPRLEHEFKFQVPKSKTLPALYPESDEFRSMPEVLATGYLVGLLEWACIEAVNPYLDWPRDQTLGTHINVSHEAATPPGFEVVVKVKLVKVNERHLTFDVEDSDDIDSICHGTHERLVVNADRFIQKMHLKATVNRS